MSGCPVSSTGKVQSYTVPHTGNYNLTMRGAAGGELTAAPEWQYGRGAQLSMIVHLNKAAVLKIIVGS
jgi:hypothetical protein